MTTHTHHWTNPSVLALAGHRDPVEVIREKARTVFFEYVQSGRPGPPVDPFDIADYLRVAVVPKDEIADARTIHTGGGRFLIEFNPSRPRSRVRYSIAHELAHTLFPDCRRKIRNRYTHQEITNDDWQLEMLCNIGASELLMPIGSFPDLETQALSVDALLELKDKYAVSTEALFLRFAELTNSRCAVFSASQRGAGAASYRVDYSIASRTLRKRLPIGLQIPNTSIVNECTAIGFTAKGEEDWYPPFGRTRIECVGIPPYPNSQLPRVMCFLRPSKAVESSVTRVVCLKGDATQPRGTGNRLIAHVVNDKTPRWGAGFGRTVRVKWPQVQAHFEDWASRNRNAFTLGNIHATKLDESTSMVQMICQRGYGPSSKPRIRYDALKSCLAKLAELAQQKQASIHMPRIGSGQAGGSWPIIEELIEDLLCEQGLSVNVYDLPHRRQQEESQGRFLWSAKESRKS